jgi:5-methylcytosine-specific restriction endonuclease McrA
MTKEYIRKKQSLDPEWYKEYRKKRKQSYLKNLKKDPIRYKKYKERRQKQQQRYRARKNFQKFERKKNSVYWQRQGYNRYFKYSPFKRLASHSNNRCKKGKVKSFELWCLAKKQKLICPLTGEKLTIKNISVDHKIPISKGGTNNISNLQLITRRANTIKNSMNMNEFYLFCKNIVDRLTPLVEGSTAAL